MNIIKLVSTIVEKEMKVRTFKMAITLLAELLLLIFFTYGAIAAFLMDVEMSEGLVYILASGQAWCICAKRAEAIYKMRVNTKK